MIGHLLNRTLAVHRPTTTSDGSGGQQVTYIHVGDVRAMVAQPTATETSEGSQWGAELSHNVYVLPDADVRRGDELRGDGQRFRVLATVEPSRAAYKKAPASELTQSEGVA